MRQTTFFDDDQRVRLSQTLKAVRRARGRTAAEVAAAMGMPLRSLEHFESGGGRFDFGKVRRFAEALDADPFAILMAVLIGSPAFAARAADNKLAMILLLGLEEFDRDHGDRLARLDSAGVLAEFGETYRRLGLGLTAGPPCSADPPE